MQRISFSLNKGTSIPTILRSLMPVLICILALHTELLAETPGEAFLSPPSDGWSVDTLPHARQNSMTCCPLLAQLQKQELSSQPDAQPKQESTEPLPLIEAPAANESEEELQAIQELQRRQSIYLGGGITARSFSLSRDEPFANGSTPGANMIDSGKLDWQFNYQSAESYLLELPLRIGHFRLGYNTAVKLSSFYIDRQTQLDANVGEDLGTSVSGSLLGIAPELFMLLGPLYQDSSIFWKAGLGIGGGLMQFDADVLFRSNSTTETSSETFSGRFNQLNWFFHIFWNMEWDNLIINYQVYQMEGNTEVGYFVFIETSISLGYKFRF